MKSNVIWIDENLDNEENKKYSEELYSFGSLIVRLFKNLDKAIEQMKHIEFQETKVIVNDKLYYEFIQKFKENIIDMCIAPKIIIFTNNKQNFIEKNKNCKNNTFYNFGGVVDSFEDVKKFLKNEYKQKNLKSIDDVQLTFEYIDKKEKLFLPLFFKTLIDNISNNNSEEYISSLYDEYSKDNEDIQCLLGSIKYIPDIPIEILSKYYARLYTTESDFFKNINKSLGLNKVEKYLPYIKSLYEGVKLKSLPLANNNILYRGTKISNDELKKIKDYIKNKIKDLPSSIVFSKSFLSFTKDKKIAENYLNIQNKNNNLSKVLFILEKDTNIEYNLCTHGDIEKISFFPNEREVLFFPFSSFEIKDIKQTIKGKEYIYEIRLLYLGKYLKDIESDKNIIINDNKIPDSEFKKQLCETGLIKKEKIEKINTKILYNNYKQYEKEIKENNNRKKITDNITNKNDNFIIGEIKIKLDDINKDINIINSFENSQRENIYTNEEDYLKYMNEREIIDNIEIKINKKSIPFSYNYRFEKEGNYTIKYTFKKNLTKTNYLFYGCSSIINLDLSNFNAQDVIDMSHMFSNCFSLTSINLSNFNTKNVNNMKDMFGFCNSLPILDLSNFNTQNVTDMSYMFSLCKLLTNLKISNFDTKNVNDMSNMFIDCNSLLNLDLSNFNTENVTDMSHMFNRCNSLTNLNISKFNTTKVNYMNDMFSNCNSLSNLDLSNFNTQNVTNMNFMFYGCNLLTNINIINFNTQKVIFMEGMFSRCNSLTYLNLSNFNTQNVTDMSKMFMGCGSLINLDLSNFNTQNVTFMNGIFSGCSSLKIENIITKDNKIFEQIEKYNY